MSNQNDLWAKSYPRDNPPTVEQHCHTVMGAADALWAATVNDWRSALGENAGDLDGLEIPLRVAALLHDLGKANSAFQAMVHGTSRNRQPVRHEALSALIVQSPELHGGWLHGLTTPEGGPLEEDFWPVVWSIGGHHLQFRKPRFGEAEDPLLPSGGIGNQEVQLFLDHPQVTAVLETVRSTLCAAGRPVPDSVQQLEERSYSVDEDDRHFLGVPIWELTREAQQAWYNVKQNPRLMRRTAILKALLIAADVAGSTFQLDELLAATRNALDARIDASSLVGVVGDVKLRKFQQRVQDVAKTPVKGRRVPVTVIEAGCGNGKTTAAYLWAQYRAVNCKLFFCYPTTGTTSAGYSEYLDDQKGLKRDLLHSRAPVDRLDFQTSADEDPIDLAHKAEALRAWGKQVVACTADQVLGLLQNNRRPLFASPAIGCGAFVFDEVHSYDDRMFRELLRFLETFSGVPTLLMSASIPPARRDALKRVLGERMSDSIHGDESLETITRYRLERRDDAEACWEDVNAALDKDMKVLWVCNTVGDAMKVFCETKQKMVDKRCLLYHSRFRYGGDVEGKIAGWPVIGRVERQKETIAEFAYADEKKIRRAMPGAALAVTTQVCEMSLDLDADLLVTPICPLPAFVQRLGRLHRFAETNDPKGKHPRLCLVYPFEGRPYHTGEAPVQMAAMNALLDERSGKPISQRDLAERLDAMNGENKAYTEPIYSAWLDGGWQSEPLPTREGSNSLTVIMEEDVEHTIKVLGKPASKLRGEEVISLTIPMLIKRGFKPCGQVAGYPVAPKGSITYSDEEGASWAD